MPTAHKAYVAITLNIAPNDRPAAANVYAKYKPPFLQTVKGALSKQLLIRDEDLLVLHSFTDEVDAQAYLSSELFQQDVVTALKPLLQAAPDVRVYMGDH
ncbi:hypothetical protein [Roseiterribacter gracilis]|uniref:Uncharacterized protein n=1 Tax=Roseiterribacter gracilis TaxID=2812848 RepID=A0A8S8X7I5_9PROT|nr:hypothetical protein TMPK1_14500 [Rhodospirillales bacterium TMPK1]